MGHSRRLANKCAKRILGGIAVLGLLSPLAVHAQSGSRRVKAEVQDIALFPVFSTIALVDAQENGVAHNGLTDQSVALLDSILYTLRDRIPVTHHIPQADSSLTARIHTSMTLLSVSADRARRGKQVEIPPLLDSVIAQSGKRYGLILIEHGFTQKTTRAKTTGTRATLAPTPVFAPGTVGIGIGIKNEQVRDASSMMYLLVLDAQENKVVWFKKNLRPGGQPLDAALLDDQIRHLVYGLF